MSLSQSVAAARGACSGRWCSWSCWLLRPPSCTGAAGARRAAGRESRRHCLRPAEPGGSDQSPDLTRQQSCRAVDDVQRVAAFAGEGAVRDAGLDRPLHHVPGENDPVGERHIHSGRPHADRLVVRKSSVEEGVLALIVAENPHAVLVACDGGDVAVSQPATASAIFV